ncbi:hypothetical protein E3G66_003724 [Mycobacteroides abscessus]|nr:hypothetical protein E3G66_003724 [Mycobacteroides abscessus]SIH77592.1 Uncharacterised protein [Mycobacteroides abscessus subsp. abscessus]SIK51720.1 Uncharacterised protein [Mycobacteroides abscessus subsp. abscessus]SIN32386.1 Uncharacterised protein [Mycobacteroides abscessus subsp. abscessus]SKR53155.1 Uncharacterised protein [Mycobacteroides abscessus subsp. abscessus]
MNTMASVNTVTADEVFNVVSAAGYGDQFAAFDPVSGAVYTVYWTESGDLVGESSPTLLDSGELQRDLVDFTRTPLPLIVWFPAGDPAGWQEMIDHLNTDE